MPKKLKVRKVEGRIKVLKALPYKGSMVYLRMVGKDIFEWLLVYKNEIYSNYIIITPRKGEKELSESEISQATGLVMAGAMSTIDMLRGDGLDKKAKEVVKTFEDHRAQLEGKGAN